MLVSAVIHRHARKAVTKKEPTHMARHLLLLGAQARRRAPSSPAPTSTGQRPARHNTHSHRMNLFRKCQGQDPASGCPPLPPARPRPPPRPSLPPEGSSRPQGLADVAARRGEGTSPPGRPHSPAMAAPRGSALTSGPAQARPRRAAQAAGAAAAALGPGRRRALSLHPRAGSCGRPALLRR